MFLCRLKECLEFRIEDECFRSLNWSKFTTLMMANCCIRDGIDGLYIIKHGSYNIMSDANLLQGVK